MIPAEATQQNQTQRNPLQLIEAPKPDALAGLSRGQPKKAKPIDYDDSLPAQYNKQLQALVTAINEDLRTIIMPQVYRLKPEYTADAWPTVMESLLTALAQKWTGSLFNAEASRVAAGTVRRIDAENGNAFLKSVNKAVGIEVFGNNSHAVATELEAATIANANLITNLSETYINQIRTTIVENMRQGFAPAKIAKDLQKKSGMTRKRAKLIARDQTAKLNGELTKARMNEAGIKYFRWVTSKDSRVGDDHKLAARRDIGYGPGVYLWAKPPREGIPGSSARPNCRCTASPVFEWEVK